MAPPAAASPPAWIAGLARTLAGIFFDEVEVTGASTVPLGQPLLFVANHNNGLVDPTLVLGFVPGRPRFLAKATLWKIPVLRQLLALARVIPVQRPQDSGSGFDPGRNEESFRLCREVLAAGGAVAIFPEGKSHAGPGLAELRTGAARIVIGLERQARSVAAVVPVGLLFDAPQAFRSRVLVQIGEPLLVEEELAATSGGGDEPSDVRRLTDAIAVALAEVTSGYRSWQEARLVERAADLWLQPDPALPVQPSLTDRFATRRAVLARYRELAAAGEPRLQPLTSALAAYDRLLRAFRLRDEQVGAAYPSPGVARFVLRSLFALLVRLPLAIVGTLLGYVPYRICGWAGALVARDPDQPATYKLFGGMLLFPLFWIGEAIAGGWRWGAVAGLVVLALGPLGGWAAVGFRDRLRTLVTEARAFLLLRGPGRLGDELRRRRDGVKAELRRLATVSPPA